MNSEQVYKRIHCNGLRSVDKLWTKIADKKA